MRCSQSSPGLRVCFSASARRRVTAAWIVGILAVLTGDAPEVAVPGEQDSGVPWIAWASATASPPVARAEDDTRRLVDPTRRHAPIVFIPSRDGAVLRSPSWACPPFSATASPLARWTLFHGTSTSLS